MATCKDTTEPHVPPGGEPTDERGEPKAVCSSCGGSRECPTCAGSGRWYAGTLDEDERSSCGGSGRCPDC
jgi:hypothetical protein